MKKRLVVVSIEREALNNYVQMLRQFFQDRIDIAGYYTNGSTLPEWLDGDLVLYTSQELVPILRSHAPASVNILPLRRVLLRSSLERLRDYPDNTNAIFFDYNTQTAKHLISLVLDSGFRNINFTPLGRDCSTQEIQSHLAGSELVVIAGLGNLLPFPIGRVVDLGWTSIDADVLIEIAMLLDCFDETFERQLFFYMHTITHSNHGIQYFLRTMTESQNKYQVIMELMEDGILVYEKDGTISYCNSALAAMFRLDRQGVTGMKIGEAALPGAIKKNLLLRQPIKDKWISKQTSGSNFTLAVYEIKTFSQVEAYVAVISSADHVQLRSSQVRCHLKRQEFRARHTFRDILGQSPAITACRQTAARIAATDGTVLITGESGTGKELFAQAIHNASARKNMPFVAINCAALTPTLLESDLFGYEAGAFTGSKSEGHIGLFVCAHEGTIFLDEIGEIPFELQAKLLRVIEEQEVRPVGSHHTIPINVRVIAATNQDLHQFMAENRFRADLYYRLSVFPLHLPPLRERPEDILLLSQAFLDAGSFRCRITPRLSQALAGCPWPGNIRELRNCIQYMASLGGETLDVGLLPPHIGPNAQRAAAPPAPGLPGFTQADRRIAGGILTELLQGGRSRTALTAALQKNGLQITEYRVRALLERLRASGLVTFQPGRAGIHLTPEGCRAAESRRSGS